MLSDAGNKILDEAAHSSFGAVAGPKWPESCGHGGYVGTFEAIENVVEGVKTYDVYVWADSHGYQEVCLRYGPEGSDYLSPGELVSVIQYAASRHRYARTVQLLEKYGKITWVPERS